MVKTSPSNAGDVGSIPGQGAKIPHASGPKNQNIKQKQYCNKFNKKTLEMVHIKKSLRRKKDMGKEVFLCNFFVQTSVGLYLHSDKGADERSRGKLK